MYRKSIIIISILISSPCFSQQIDDAKAVLAIIGEAENQGLQGMIAVACGIRNRGSLKGVYGLNAPRVIKHKFSKAIEKQAVDAWITSEDKDNCSFLDGADHWENIKEFGKPSWTKSMHVTYKHKDHVFYKNN